MCMRGWGGGGFIMHPDKLINVMYDNIYVNQSTTMLPLDRYTYQNSVVFESFCPHFAGSSGLSFYSPYWFSMPDNVFTAIDKETCLSPNFQVPPFGRLTAETDHFNKAAVEDKYERDFPAKARELLPL